MATHGNHYAHKHPPGSKPDPTLARILQDRAQGGTISCALAFRMARESGSAPQEVGRTADLLEIRITKCQLGLFGYQPEKKVVKPAPEVPGPLREAIERGLVAGRLPCSTAWDIAATLKLPKMAVSSACEKLGIKIGPCQLGSF